MRMEKKFDTFNITFSDCAVETEIYLKVNFTGDVFILFQPK